MTKIETFLDDCTFVGFAQFHSHDEYLVLNTPQILPISTIAIFFMISGNFSKAWKAAIITLLNTQKPHDEAVVNSPSVPA